MTDGLPPYRPTARRRTEVRVDVANASDNASEPPVYDGRSIIERRSNENEINNNTFDYRHINNPNDPPPDYFAAASTDCPHWVLRRCRLTARPRHCCSCMDSRDESDDGRYPVYMDGYSEPGTVVRWAHYCDACRAAECRAHNEYDTSARPPDAQKYRPSGNEQARTAKELADAKAAFASGKGGDDSWFRWETSGQKRERERRERLQRKEEGRRRYEALKAADDEKKAAKKKEEDESKKDTEWETDQLQRLSRGEAVSGLTVRRHFLSLSSKDKDKGKGKEKETRTVGIYREYANPSYEEEGESSVQITPADVRAARLAWEESVEAEQRAERQRQEQEEERQRDEREDERKLEAKKKRDKEKREQEKEKQTHVPNEYLAYGDGPEAHRSVSRTISREENRRRSLGSRDKTPWYIRLFRRRA